jgi:hypothetical protein
MCPLTANSGQCERLFRLQPEIDHPDLAPRPGAGRFLQGLVDQRAGGIGVVDCEEQDLLAGLAEQVEQVARGPGRLALRGEQGAVVPLRPGILLQRLEKARQ